MGKIITLIITILLFSMFKVGIDWISQPDAYQIQRLLSYPMIFIGFYFGFYGIGLLTNWR